MKKRLYIYIVFFLSIAFYSHADILHLTDGRTLTCEQWWKEGTNIKYTFFGATIAIPESKVVKIEKTERRKSEAPKKQGNDAAEEKKSDNEKEEPSSDYSSTEGACKYLTDGLFLSDEGHRISVSADCENGFLNAGIRIKDGTERYGGTIYITLKNNEGRKISISSELGSFGGNSDFVTEEYIKRCSLYETGFHWKIVSVSLR